jgi:hypothetical protein
MAKVLWLRVPVHGTSLCLEPLTKKLDAHDKQFSKKSFLVLLCLLYMSSESRQVHRYATHWQHFFTTLRQVESHGNKLQLASRVYSSQYGDYWHQVGGWITEPECKCQTMPSYTSWIKGGDSTPLFWLFCTCGRSLAEKLYSRPLSTEREEGELQLPFVLCSFFVLLGATGWGSFAPCHQPGSLFVLFFLVVFFSIYGCN